jgi:hypothetical protein
VSGKAIGKEGKTMFDFLLGFLLGSSTSSSGAPMHISPRGIIKFVVALSIITGVLYFLFWSSGEAENVCINSSGSAMGHAMCELANMSGSIVLFSIAVAAIAGVLLMLI